MVACKIRLFKYFEFKNKDMPLTVEKKLLPKSSSAHNYKLNESNGETTMKPNYVNSDFSKKMIDCRQAMKWTRQQFAQQAGLTEKVIGLYETGKAIKNDQEMNKIQRCIQRALQK